MEHGQQGQVHADETVLRDDRDPREARVRHREPRPGKLAEGRDGSAGDAGARASHATAPQARKRQAHRASDELEERIAELEQAEVGARAQIGALGRELATIDAICEQSEPLPLAANG
jgi:hypothetical protein